MSDNYYMYKYKTNINCGSCINMTKDLLNELYGENNWSVDTDNPDKILSVNKDVEDLESQLESLGFKAEKIN